MAPHPSNSSQAGPTRPLRRLVGRGRRAGRWLWERLENESLMGLLLTLATLGIGILMMLASNLKPWLEVPIGVQPVDEMEMFEVVLRDGRFTKHFRMFLLAVLAGMGLTTAMAAARNTADAWRSWRIANARQLLILIVVLLFFPWATIAFDRLGTHAAWLQDQHYNLTWLGGDVYNNQDAKDDIPKTGMLLSDNPHRTGAYPLPEGAAGGLRLANLQFVLLWFGYGLSFTQFDGLGWFLAIEGAVIAFLGILRLCDLPNTASGVARRIFLAPTLLFCALTAMAVLPNLAAGELLTNARLFHAAGKYELSLHQLERAAKWLPVIREHTHFVIQKGALLNALDRTQAPEAKLVQSLEKESLGLLAEAEYDYWELLDREPNHMPAAMWQPVSREAFRSLVRAGLDDLNSGQADRALETFAALLERCPEAVKPAFAMQFAALRLGRAEECTRLANRLTAVYQGFDALEQRGVLSAVQENAARAHFLDNNTRRSVYHHRRSIRP